MAESGEFSRQYPSKDGVACEYVVEWQRSWRMVVWTAHLRTPGESETVLRSMTANVSPADDPTEAVAADVQELIEESLSLRQRPGANAPSSAGLGKR
jgi:hypothetical protein